MAAREEAAAGRQKAARAVMARRGELGMDRRELADAAGIDPKTLYNLEVKGRWPIAVTRARIETALRWPSGEMERMAAEQSEPEPELPPSLLADIYRTFPDEEGRQRAIRLFRRTLAEGVPGLPEAGAPQGRQGRRAG